MFVFFAVIIDAIKSNFIVCSKNLLYREFSVNADYKIVSTAYYELKGIKTKEVDMYEINEETSLTFRDGNTGSIERISIEIIGYNYDKLIYDCEYSSNETIAFKDILKLGR